MNPARTSVAFEHFAFVAASRSRSREPVLALEKRLRQRPRHGQLSIRGTRAQVAPLIRAEPPKVSFLFVFTHLSCSLFTGKEIGSPSIQKVTWMRFPVSWPLSWREQQAVREGGKLWTEMDSMQASKTRLRISRLFWFFLFLIATPLLVACGGGGAGSGGTTATDVSAPASPPAPPPPSPPPPAPGTPSVSLTASPASVASGGTSTLTWSAANVSSCTASGAWSGSKLTIGSQGVGPLAATSTYTLTCNGTSSNVSRSATITVGSTIGGLPIPSLDDERATYQRWGWTWTPDKEPGAVTERISGYTVTSPDIHGDTEGDDLWTYLMMYRRTANPVYLNRAKAWLDYFENRYITSPEFSYDQGFLLDHLYGWGLIAWYEYTGDTAALTAAENIGAQSEAYWNELDSTGNPRYVPGQYTMASYSLRQGARHLLLATRLAEVTKKQRWITLRDKLINLWLQSPDWDAQRGMYFMGQWYTDEEIAPTTDCKYTGAPSCPYEQGARIVPSFHITMLTEAFDQAYRTTGNVDLKNRIVAMAKFVDQYGMDATYQYSGKTFGIVNGQPWSSYSGEQNPVTFWDPVYTTSLVNTLVRGYKYTADPHFYDRAKYFFNRGTKGIYGSPTAREASDNVVGHFVDTVFASSTGFFYLDYNKGELQYTYLMFEAP